MAPGFPLPAVLTSCGFSVLLDSRPSASERAETPRPRSPPTPASDAKLKRTSVSPDKAALAHGTALPLHVSAIVSLAPAGRTGSTPRSRQLGSAGPRGALRSSCTVAVLSSSSQPGRRVLQLTPMAAARIQPQPGCLRRDAASEHRGRRTRACPEPPAACCTFNLTLRSQLNELAFSERWPRHTPLLCLGV